MDGEKRFGTSLVGFKKKDVNNYIEKILFEFDNKLKEKDNEVMILKNQMKEEKGKYQVAARDSEIVREERSQIADVLIKAKMQADLILEEGKLEAERELKNYESLIKKEKHKFIEVKNDIVCLKSEAILILNKYVSQLADLEANSQE
jgi:cell division initiation protein